VAGNLKNVIMKIKVVEIIGKESFLIKSSELGINTDFYINREIIPNELKSQGITIKKNDVVEYLPKTKELIGYEKGEVFLSVSDYNLKPQYYNSDSSEETVLRAIANRKELEGFEPKYKEIDFESVEIEIYGNVQDTKSNFIHCGITGRWSSSPVVYTVNQNDIAVAEYKKLRSVYSSHATFEDLERNYIRFAKINGDFAFSNHSWLAEIKNEKMFLSLEDAIKHEKEIRDLVQKLTLKKVFTEKINDIKKIMLLSHLKAIKKAKTKSVMDEMLQILITDIQDYQKGVELKDRT
jgi:hypothetical protein